MNLLSLIIAPLQAVVLFFAPHAAHTVSFKTSSPRQPVRTTPSQRAVPMQRDQAGQVSPLRAQRVTYPQSRQAVTAKPIHHVRVVRNVDTTLPADRAGRMVVSGRFADVCAELDRLAALGMRTA